MLYDIIKVPVLGVVPYTKIDMKMKTAWQKGLRRKKVQVKAKLI
jgi:hypothetical protein